jgi:hypothetical protein
MDQRVVDQIFENDENEEEDPGDQLSDVKMEGNKPFEGYQQKQYKNSLVD